MDGSQPEDSVDKRELKTSDETFFCVILKGNITFILARYFHKTFYKRMNKVNTCLESEENNRRWCLASLFLLW